MPTFFTDSGSFKNLQITGSTIMSASSGLVLQIIGSGSTLFSISGSSGELFKISDSGSSTVLFSVSSGSVTEFQISSTGVTIGNVITDVHNITGSLRVSGSITGSLLGTSSWATNATTASTADAFTVRGNLIVSGNTTIGDATTDTITLTAATMSLGSGTGILNIDSNTFVVDGANNRVGIGKANPNSALDVNGNTILSGSLTFAAPTSPAFNGEIVRFGAGTLTTGQLYFLSSSGTWSLADASTTGSSTGMLGIAVGSSPTTNGLLIRGFAASSSYTYGTGSVVYMATGSGIMTATSPSSSNHVVRVMGYQTTLSNTIYFDPDKTWVTLA